jgi:LDH2 family malate/lactate/ureidoglycolate dehydrogenase
MAHSFHSPIEAHRLILAAQRCLEAVGLDRDMAACVAQVLVEGDLLGHSTHGLALLPGYLAELEKGGMARSGEVVALAERACVATWDGGRLPGPWLVQQALAWARPRAQMYGSATITIRRAHHIACLAAYLEDVARSGLMVVLASSDPAVASVAPAGGTQAVFTPNPIAVGIPTGGEPILIDISASITTNGMSNRLYKAGQTGPHAWWQDALGQATNDPAVLFANPPGTLLPLGGQEAGHKGMGLALLVEALTAGLTGFGRADQVEGWGATVWLQLYDPEAFAGLGAYTGQMDWLADGVKASRARDSAHPPRLPGHRGLALKREQLEHGVSLHPSVMPALVPWLEKLGVAI